MESSNGFEFGSVFKNRFFWIIYFFGLIWLFFLTPFLSYVMSNTSLPDWAYRLLFKFVAFFCYKHKFLLVGFCAIPLLILMKVFFKNQFFNNKKIVFSLAGIILLMDVLFVKIYCTLLN